ncbi:hypothetical protein ENUP19_0347G0054 [Entamoeba nuttalli]|uniref:Rab family GTPase n=1 Tax=Entamoeba nuttalli TaxID=412467 RepID=A0ABQ0DXV6_9EUKA
MREGNVFTLVYSIVDTSFILMVVVGNKCDLEKERNVSATSAQRIEDK